MKEAIFLGDALKAIRAFPEDARRMAGRQIRRVQRGQDPIDWKPFPTIGLNVREIRIRESGGAFRVIYQATITDIVVIISAFEKKAQKTPQHEIQKARARLAAFMRRGSRQ
ncbi:MAG TPA: type II toxin-antitoxin system RelE/ParE family toxin [Dongiaceae bacterium]|nr:type II toxin-antitoxin system RelE/ParE family toxin [Dongiaceae bacterium]